jgi:hypothetical protein
MKHLLFAIALVALVAGCVQPGPPIGGDRDEHGCLPAAGYSWCELKQKCLREWEEPCSALNDCGVDHNMSEEANTSYYSCFLPKANKCEPVKITAVAPDGTIGTVDVKGLENGSCKIFMSYEVGALPYNGTNMTCRIPPHFDESAPFLPSWPGDMQYCEGSYVEAEKAYAAANPPIAVSAQGVGCGSREGTDWASVSLWNRDPSRAISTTLYLTDDYGKPVPGIANVAAGQQETVEFAGNSAALTVGKTYSIYSPKGLPSGGVLESQFVIPSGTC